MKRREKASVVLAVQNPDGTERRVTLALDGTTLTVTAPFEAAHDRFTISGRVDVPLRIVEVRA